MAHLDFISRIHKSTKRDYVQRVVEFDKAACAQISKQFGKDYFDGDRQYGYGGYKYDGRWRPFAENLIAHYALKAGDKVLDIGCAKGFLVTISGRRCRDWRRSAWTSANMPSPMRRRM